MFLSDLAALMFGRISGGLKHKKRGDERLHQPMAVFLAPFTVVGSEFAVVL